MSWYVEDWVGINFEGNFDLWDTTGGLWKTSQVEFTQKMVILGHGSFSFEDLDGNGLLVILIGSKDLWFLGGDERTSGDNGRHNTSNSFYTEGEGSSVNDNDITQVFGIFTTDDSTLNGGTKGDGLIGVNTSIGLLSVEEILD